MRRPVLAALAAAALLGATPVLAQTAAPAPAPAPAASDRAARSKDCSDQANTKGLHGRARKHFRRACMRGRSTG